MKGGLSWMGEVDMVEGGLSWMGEEDMVEGGLSRMGEVDIVEGGCSMTLIIFTCLFLTENSMKKDNMSNVNILHTLLQQLRYSYTYI